MIANCPNCNFVFSAGDDVPAADLELDLFYNRIKAVIQVFVWYGGGMDAFAAELDRNGWGSPGHVDRITNKHTWRKIFAHFEPIVEKLEKAAKAAKPDAQGPHGGD